VTLASARCFSLCALNVTLSMAVAMLSACGGRVSKLPKYDRVPQFQMTDSEGMPFDSRQVADKVWIADFIYTNCPGPCPMMSSRMQRVADQLKDDPDVRLVSFSVDPAHDTPPVLAHRFGAPTKQWVFLTGTPETVHLLAYTTFHLGDVIGKVDHSTKFVLVDKNGYIRGYYSSLGEQDEISQLLQDVAALR